MHSVRKVTREPGGGCGGFALEAINATAWIGLAAIQGYAKEFVPKAQAIIKAAAGEALGACERPFHRSMADEDGPRVLSVKCEVQDSRVKVSAEPPLEVAGKAGQKIALSIP